MKKVLLIGGSIFLSLLLIANIVFSQNIRPLYFYLINEDKRGVIDFLKQTISLPYFNGLLTINKNIYGNSVEDEVFSRTREREKQIARLESALKINPSARDVLYGLYLLNLADNNQEKAEGWLSKAREVDPDVR